MQSLEFAPECVATTKAASREADHAPSNSNNADDTGSLFKEWGAHSAQSQSFRSAEWTADGTTVITSSADSSISTYVVPPELLDEREEVLELSPYSTIKSREPVNALAVYPQFDLQSSNTTIFLSSVRDHPIRLNSALDSAFHLGIIASYPLVNPRTEAYIIPSSLLFSQGGGRFIAGSDSLISIFDVSRPGQQPVASIPTALKKSSDMFNPAANLKGIVSALAVEEQSGILAAGTFTRHLGLYDSSGLGECVGVFTVAGTEADSCIGGSGVTQVLWSPCGRYLYIVERKSNGVMVYDIRQTGQLVCWLEGRNAVTNQRLGVATAATDQGHDIWAGGVDGKVRVWRDPHKMEGGLEADNVLSVHDGTVSSAVLHPQSAVLATSSADCLRIWAGSIP